jgi:hypothetical protein
MCKPFRLYLNGNLISVGWSLVELLEIKNLIFNGQWENHWEIRQE